MGSPTLNQPPFTIDNLPYGVFRTSRNPYPRCAVAIGQHALDLAEYAKTGRLSSLQSGHNFSFENVFSQVSLSAQSLVDLNQDHVLSKLCSLL